MFYVLCFMFYENYRFIDLLLKFSNYICKYLAKLFFTCTMYIIYIYIYIYYSYTVIK